MSKNLTPSISLLYQVRAGFIAKGTNLHRWCAENEVRYPNARQALIGSWDGPKGALLRNKLISDSGI